MLRAMKSEQHSRTSRRGALLVVAAATLWSTGGVGVKVAVAEPLVVAGLRSAFALAFIPSRWPWPCEGAVCPRAPAS